MTEQGGDNTMLPGNRRNARRGVARVAAMALAGCPALAVASLPLSIDNLMSPAGALRLETGLGFATGRLGVYSPATGGRFRQSAQSLRLRWGIREDLELQAGIVQRETTPEDDARGAAGGRTRLGERGVSWQVSPDRRTPAVILSATVDVVERFDGALAVDRRGLSGELGIEVYRAIDPVVLSLSAGYRHGGKLALAGAGLRRSDSWYLAPRVNFAVNPRVTLIGGMAITRHGAVRLNGVAVTAARSSVEPLIGLGYRAGPHSTFFLQGRFSGSGEQQASVSVDWVYRF